MYITTFEAPIGASFTIGGSSFQGIDLLTEPGGAGLNFFFFSWKLHVTYLKCLVTLDLHKAGEEKVMSYETPKYIFYPVSPTWLLLDLPLCKSLSDIIALLA